MQLGTHMILQWYVMASTNQIRELSQECHSYTMLPHEGVPMCKGLHILHFSCRVQSLLNWMSYSQ